MLSRVVLGLSLVLIAPPLLAAEAKKTPLTPVATTPAPVTTAPAMAAPVAASQTAPATIPDKGIDSGLPLPRFVSLASEKVNARTGPGSRYPIAWQYQRRGLPVEVVAEYEYWRRIRDHDGTETWVHKNLTSGKRYATVEGSVRSLYKKADTATEVLLTAEPGVQARLRKCPDVAWCQVEIAGTRGWIPRAHLWGIYPSETFD
ncbi:SH3 domain-containing protein [Ferrovibrio terrae]|uniref:SH3 domain-containing protein n=1 Tax=Ferrovibrio terrae TaxID=2594003 RepID=UPI003137A0EA